MRKSAFPPDLWATDGCTRLRSTTHGQTGTVYYATTSSVLAGQVQHLLARLGIASHVYSTRRVIIVWAIRST